MRLHCWNRAAQDIEFDPRTGSARVVRLGRPRDESIRPIGFAQFERTLLGVQHVFAVFRQGDAIWLAVGSRRWRLDQPDLVLTHTRLLPFVSRFRLIERGRVEVSILYSHVGRLLFGLVDPTYDKLDEESDYFLSFLAEYAPSPEWQKNVLELWSSAPTG